MGKAPKLLIYREMLLAATSSVSGKWHLRSLQISSKQQASLKALLGLNNCLSCAMCLKTYNKLTHGQCYDLYSFIKPLHRDMGYRFPVSYLTKGGLRVKLYHCVWEWSSLSFTFFLANFLPFSCYIRLL